MKLTKLQKPGWLVDHQILSKLKLKTSAAVVNCVSECEMFNYVMSSPVKFVYVNDIGNI